MLPKQGDGIFFLGRNFGSGLPCTLKHTLHVVRYISVNSFKNNLKIVFGVIKKYYNFRWHYRNRKQKCGPEL